MRLLSQYEIKIRIYKNRHFQWLRHTRLCQKLQMKKTEQNRIFVLYTPSCGHIHLMFATRANEWFPHPVSFKWTQHNNLNAAALTNTKRCVVNFHSNIGWFVQTKILINFLPTNKKNMKRFVVVFHSRAVLMNVLTNIFVLENECMDCLCLYTVPHICMLWEYGLSLCVNRIYKFLAIVLQFK